MSRFADKNVRRGAAVIGVGFALLLLSFAGVLRSMVSGGDGESRTVKAVFANASQLHPGDLVRVGGVDVGKVDGVVLDDGGRSATVTMKVKKSAGTLYNDARADARWRLLLGANFYVRLTPGTRTSGELGSRPISMSRTGGQAEIEDLTSIAQGGARQGLQTLPGELARALRDPEPLAKALETLVDVSPSLDAGLRGVRGRQPEGEDLRALVRRTAATVRSLDTPTDQLRRVVAGAAATFETTAARQADLRATLSESPGVLQRTDLTLSKLNRTLGLADTVIGRLQAPAPQVAVTLAELRPTLVGADTLGRRAVPLLRSLRPAVASLARTAKVGRPLLEELVPSLDRLDDTILPYLNKKDPQTDHTISQMIGPTVGGLGAGAAGQQDQNGHFIRFPATVGNNPAYLPCAVFLNNPDKADELLTCQTLQEAMKTFLTYEPISPPPPPGAANPRKP